MIGCRYPLCLHQEPIELSEEKKPERSQPENLRQLIEVSYHEWKSLARCKGAEASIVWVRETQAGADNFAATIDTEKPNVWQNATSQRQPQAQMMWQGFQKLHWKLPRIFLKTTR